MTGRWRRAAVAALLSCAALGRCDNPRFSCCPPGTCPPATTNCAVSLLEDGEGSLQCAANPVTGDADCTFQDFLVSVDGGAADLAAAQAGSAPHEVLVGNASLVSAADGALFSVWPQLVLDSAQGPTKGTLTFSLRRDASADPDLSPTEAAARVRLEVADNSSAVLTRDMLLTVSAVNDPPVVEDAPAAVVTVDEDSGRYVRPGFLTGVWAAASTASNELPPSIWAQAVEVNCSLDDEADRPLFTELPAVTMDSATGNGTLTFAAAADAETSVSRSGGNVSVTCSVRDVRPARWPGGKQWEPRECVQTVAGGAAVDCPLRFAVVVAAVNDPPVANLSGIEAPSGSGVPTLSLSAESGPQQLPDFMTGIRPAAAANTWEQPPVQTVPDTIACAAANASLFSGIVRIVTADAADGSKSGALQITPATALTGELPLTTRVTCTVSDSLGGTLAVDFDVELYQPAPVWPPLPNAPAEAVPFSLYPPTFPEQYVRRWSEGELTVKLPSPAPGPVTLSPMGSGLTFQPNPIEFAPFDQSKTFRVHGMSPGDITVSWTCSDDTYFECLQPSLLRVKENVFTFEPSPLPTLYANKTSPAITVRVAAPVRSSVVLSCVGDAGAVISPPQLTWNASTPPVLTDSFTITHDRVQQGMPVSCSLDGPDKDDFDPPAITVDVRPQFEFTPSAYPPMRVGATTSVSVRVYQPPAVALSLTPSTLRCLSFSPTTLSFSPTAATATFTVTSSCGGDHLVTYALGGASAASYDAPTAPDIVAVTEPAWGLRFGAGSYFPTGSDPTIPSVQFGAPLPPIRVELTDSAGQLDTASTAAITVTATPSDGNLAGASARMTNGVAVFDSLRFTDHPTNPMLTFTATSAQAVPVSGKSIVGGPVAVAPVPAYSMRFAQTGSIFTAPDQPANISVQDPFSAVVIEVLQSDGTRDVGLSGLIVSAASNQSGVLAGAAATVMQGRAVFNQLRFLNMPPRSPRITFTASTQGGFAVGGATLTTGLVRVHADVCTDENSSMWCTCSGAVDGAPCDDSSSSTVLDECWLAGCTGTSTAGFTAVPAGLQSHTPVMVRVTGGRLPSSGDSLRVAPPGTNCSVGNMTWPGGAARSAAASLPGERVFGPFTPLAATAAPVVLCYDADGGGPALPLPVPAAGGQDGTIAAATPVVSAVSCSSGSPSVGCRDGVVTVSGRLFDARPDGSTVQLTGGVGSAPVCSVTEALPAAPSAATRLLCTLAVPAGTSGVWVLKVIAGGKVSRETVTLAVLNPYPVVSHIRLDTCSVPLAAPSGGLPKALQGCRPGSLTITGRGFATSAPSLNDVSLQPVTSLSPPAVGATPTCTPTAATGASVHCALAVPDGTLGTWQLRISVGGVLSRETVYVAVSGPAPAVTAVSSQQCQSGSGGLALVNCTDGPLTVAGSGFSTAAADNRVVFVWAGPPPQAAETPTCAPVQASTTGRLTCPLAVPPAAAGLWRLQVKVLTAAAAATTDGATVLAVNPRPVIRTLSSPACAAVSSGLALSGCSDGLLTVTARHLDTVAISANVVQLWGGSAPDGAPTCVSQSFTVGSTAGEAALVCSLKVPPSAGGLWQVAVAVSGRRSEEAATLAVQNPAPRIALVTLPSCSRQASGTTVAGCDDGTLTIQGQGQSFGRSGNEVVLTGGRGPAPSCAPVTSVSASVLRCPFRVTAGICRAELDSGTACAEDAWSLSVRTGGVLSAEAVSVSVVGTRPAVARVTGPACRSDGPSASAVCGGGPLTIHGAHFDAAPERNVVTFERAVGATGQAPQCSLDGLGPTELNGSTQEAVVCWLRAQRGVGGAWYPQVASNGVGSANAAVSVSALASPEVLTVVGGGCQPGGAPDAVSLCAGGQPLTITGLNFADGEPAAHEVLLVARTAGVGTPRCTVSAVQSGRLTCMLTVPENAAGVYDLRVRLDDAMSYPGAELSSRVAVAPSITSAAGGGCSPPGPGPALGGCRGGPLTVSGRGFGSDSVVELHGGTGAAPSCTGTAALPSADGAERLGCFLRVPAGSGGVWLLAVGTTDHLGNRRRSDEVVSLRLSAALNVTAVSGGGCAVTGLSASGCRGGEFVLKGTGFGTDAAAHRVEFRGGSGPPPTCRPTSVQAGAVLVCALAVPAGSSGSWRLWAAGHPATELEATSVTVEAAAGLRPVMAGVSGGGCVGGTSTARTGCGGGLLTVAGRHFDPAATAFSFRPSVAGASGAAPVCEAQPGQSSEQQLCRLSAPSGVSDAPFLLVATAGGMNSTDTVSLTVEHKAAVFAVSGGGCDGGETTAAAGCIGGVLTVIGANFGAGTVVQLQSVGGEGQPTCAVRSAKSSELQCLLTVPGAARGLFVLAVSGGQAGTSAGGPTLDLLARPSVSAVAGGGCTVVGGRLADCEGGPLLISGADFDPNRTAVSLVAGAGGVAAAGSQPTCTAAAVTAAEIRCQLNVPAGSSGEWRLRVATRGLVAADPFALSVRPPPPSVTGAEGGGCAGTAVQSALGGCSGGTLTVHGTSFHPTPAENSVLFAGGVGTAPRCLPDSRSTSTRITCELRVLPGSSGRWQLTVSSQGRAAASSMELEVLPVLRLQRMEAGGCETAAADRPSVQRCVGGAELLITAAGLYPGSSLNTVLFEGGVGAAPICSVTAATYTELRCSLDVMAAGARGAWNLRVVSNGLPSVNTGSLMVYEANQPPTVTAAQGSFCEPTDGSDPARPSSALQYCREGRLTLVGTGFDPFSAGRNAVGFSGGVGPAPTCRVLAEALSSTSLVCELAIAAATDGQWTARVSVPGFSGTDGVTVSVWHPSEPVALSPQLLDRAGTLVRCQLSDDITAFDALRWRHRVAEFMQRVFTYSSGDKQRFPITAVRVALQSVAQGSTRVDFVFSAAEEGQVGSAELTNRFVAASEDPLDSVGLRRDLRLTAPATTLAHISAPALLQSSAAAPSEEPATSDDSWLSSNWWVLLLLLLLAAALIGLLVLMLVRRRRRGGKAAEKAAELDERASEPHAGRDLEGLPAAGYGYGDGDAGNPIEGQFGRRKSAAELPPAQDSPIGSGLNSECSDSTSVSSADERYRPGAGWTAEPVNLPA